MKGVRAPLERGGVRENGDAGGVLVAGRDVDTPVVVEVRGGHDPAAAAGRELGGRREGAIRRAGQDAHGIGGAIAGDEIEAPVTIDIHGGDPAWLRAGRIRRAVHEAAGDADITSTAEPVVEARRQIETPVFVEVAGGQHVGGVLPEHVLTAERAGGGLEQQRDARGRVAGDGEVEAAVEVEITGHDALRIRRDRRCAHPRDERARPVAVPI